MRRRHAPDQPLYRLGDKVSCRPVKRDEFLKNLAYTEILFNNKFMPMGSGCRHFVFPLSIQQTFPLIVRYPEKNNSKQQGEKNL